MAAPDPLSLAADDALIGDDASTLLSEIDQVLANNSVQQEVIERERLRDLTLLGEYAAPPGENQA